MSRRRRRPEEEMQQPGMPAWAGAGGDRAYYNVNQEIPEETRRRLKESPYRAQWVDRMRREGLEQTKNPAEMDPQELKFFDKDWEAGGAQLYPVTGEYWARRKKPRASFVPGM